jgi:hypothetical protein
MGPVSDGWSCVSGHSVIRELRFTPRLVSVYVSSPPRVRRCGKQRGSNSAAFFREHIVGGAGIPLRDTGRRSVCVYIGLLTGTYCIHHVELNAHVT